MKKIIIIAMMLAAAAAFSLDITRNRLEAGGEFDYMMPAEKLTGMGITIPGVNYQFEAKPNDMLKLYLYGGAYYTMTSWTYDGESFDESQSDMHIDVKPALKVYLPNSLFGKVVLPYYFHSYTAPIKDAEAIGMSAMNAELQFGYDARKVYVHGLTPWDLFEDGIIAYGFYNMGLMQSYDGESIDDKASYVGFNGCYAYYKDAMMIKPYLKYKMQMNEDAGAKDTQVVIGANFVKDFSEKFNLEADLNLDILDTEFSTYDAAADEFLDRLMEMNIGAIGNFYVMPELDVYAGLMMNMDLSFEEGENATTILVGAAYTLNFVK